MIPNAPMPLPECIIRLNDYTIGLSNQELTVDGPNADIAHEIGRRFLELIKTHEGFGLLAKAAAYEDASDAEGHWDELIELLRVPPRNGGE